MASVARTEGAEQRTKTLHRPGGGGIFLFDVAASWLGLKEAFALSCLGFKDLPSLFLHQMFHWFFLVFLTKFN